MNSRYKCISIFYISIWKFLHLCVKHWYYNSIVLLPSQEEASGSRKKSFYMSMEKNKAQTLMVQYSMFIRLYYTAQTDKPKH